MAYLSSPFHDWSTLWRTLGSELFISRNTPAAHPGYVWPSSSANLLSTAGSVRFLQRRKDFDSLIERARAVFAPLGEPLDLNFGAHNWLKSKREEVYSDWLAWILGHMSSGEIVDLFEARTILAEAERDKPPLKIHRELYVLKGHEGASGRLDILVVLPGKAALVLELKKVSVAEADIEKQKGYVEHMERQDLSCSYFILTTDRSRGKLDDDKFGVMPHRDTGSNLSRWEVIPYRDICCNLRSWVANKISGRSGENFTLLAMTLAFVSAVETNLLNFTLPVNGIASQAILNHLNKIIKGS